MGLGQALGYDLKTAQHMRRNRDIAYDIGMQDFINKSKRVEINGTYWRVHENLNCYIDMTAHCQYDCKFCIAKTSYDRMTKYFDLAAIKHNMAIIRPLNPSIQVTGGEPGLYPDELLCISDFIKQMDFRTPVLNTNGLALTLPYDFNFEHINVSAHHYNEKEQKEIFNRKNLVHYRVDRYIRHKVRMQCNMIGGYIDTYGEVMQYIAWAYHKMNCNNIVFAQLTPLPVNTMYQQSIIDYVNDRQVDANAILDQIEKDARFRFVKWRCGVACYYEIWEYSGYDTPVTVQFKYSDNKYLEMVDNMEGYIPDIIIHTNGTMCGSWNRNKKVLRKSRRLSA
jgi:organic radical activating enzyme